MNLKSKFKKNNKIFTPIVPSGLIAHTEKGFFYIKGAKRFKFVSDRARESWNLPVINTVEAMLAKIPVSGLLGFRDGSLLKDISDGKMYLVSDNKRRHITDPDVLIWLNCKVIEVGEKEISIHQLGDKLNG